MALAWKNRTHKIIPSKHLLIGMIIGLAIGMCIIIPLSDNNILFFNKFETNRDYYIELDANNESIYNISTLADRLYNEVKVLCWIMTGPKNHQSKAIHVKATWGKRCNRLLFMSTQEDPSLPSIALPVKEDRANLWGKTKEAFKYIYQNHYDEADWFFKADDDTYAIMENMRYLLHYQNTSDPVYFGFRFKPYVKQGYMSGGAGYVLSKEALKRFVVDALPNSTICKKANTGSEDAEIGKCLEAVGVQAGDSRDNIGRSTFMPLYITAFLLKGQPPKTFWFWNYTYYPFQTGMECCSDYLITVHYVNPQTLYLLEYLIYHIKLFGLTYNNSTLDPLVFGGDPNKSNVDMNLPVNDALNTTELIIVKTEEPMSGSGRRRRS